MKKILAIVVLILLLSVSSVFAADYMLPSTVLDFFPLGSQKADVIDALGSFSAMNCEDGANDNGDTYIYCTYDMGSNGKHTYEFQFDLSTEEMFQVITRYVLPVGADYMNTIMEAISDLGLDTSVQPYSTNATARKCEAFEKCDSTLINDDKVILTIGGNPETDDNYAIVTLYFFDRVWESNPAAAEETGRVFKPQSVLDFVNFDMSKDDVNAVLNSINGIGSITSSESKSFSLGSGSTSSSSLSTTVEIDGEKDTYTFSFDQKGKLFMAQIDEVLPEGTDVKTILDFDYDKFGLADSEGAENADFCADFEYCGVYLKDDVFYLLGGNEETETDYALLVIRYEDAR